MSNSKINTNLSICLFFLGIVLCLVYMMMPVGKFSQFLFDFGQIILIVCVYIFFSFSQRSSLRGYWLKPSNLFLIAFLAVNFQYLLDYRLGLKDDLSSYIIHPEVLNQCYLLGLIGLLAFTAGYLRSTSEDRRVYRPVKNGLSKETLLRLRTPLIALHLVVFLAFVFTIDIDAFLSGESYGESMDTYAHIEKLLGALNVLIVAYSACFASNGGKSFKQFIASFPLISLLVIIAYMLLRLISGDRGPFVYTLLLIFYGYSFVSRRKYKLLTTLIILVIGAASMAIIGIARNMDLSQDFIYRVGRAGNVLAESGRFSSDRSAISLTEEFGFSFVVNQTDVYAIEVEKEALHPGSYLILSVLSGIPFVPGLITRLFHIDYADFSSTGFANVHFFNTYERTWSIGTTIVGDFYLQFSVFGVLLGLFLAGWLMKEVDLSIYSKDKNSISAPLLLFVFVYASKSLYVPRSLLFGELSTFIIALILFYILKWLSPRQT